LQKKKTTGHYYEIRVECHLGSAWKEWFDCLEIRPEVNQETGLAVTTLVGYFADQAAFHGLLQRIRDLNLNMIFVKRLDEQAAAKYSESKKE
jgi:hypothetical protein